jgi:hypothetical protein
MRAGEFAKFVDRTLMLRMTNGETAKVKVNFLDEEAGEIVGAVLEASDPEHYRSACAMHTFAAADIVRAELSETDLPS